MANWVNERLAPEEEEWQFNGARAAVQQEVLHH